MTFDSLPQLPQRLKKTLKCKHILYTYLMRLLFNIQWTTVALQNTGLSKVEFCICITVSLVIFQQTFLENTALHANVCMRTLTLKKEEELI